MSAITYILILILVVSLCMNKIIKNYIIYLNGYKKPKILFKRAVASGLNILNTDTFRLIIPIIGAMLVFFGLLFFISSYRLAEASNINNIQINQCNKVNVSIVNSTNNSMEVFGVGKKINITPHSVGEYNILLNRYYTRCGRIDVKTQDGFQKMLVKDKSKNISIRYSVNSDGKQVIDTAGIAHKNLDEYVDWNGLAGVL